MSPEILNVTAQEWGGRLITASWQGALAAAGVWLLCRGARLSPRTRCWLWWLVGMRLVAGLLPIGTVGLAVLPSVSAPVHPSSGVTTIESIAPAEKGSSAAENAFWAEEAETAAGAVPAVPLAPAVWLMAAWFLGVGIRLTIAGRQTLLVRQIVREAEPVRDGPVLTLLDGLLRDAGVRRSVELREHARLRGPLVAGLWRPLILLPSSASSALSEEELRMALAHEVVHLRHGDLLFSLLPCLAQALFFFHPFAWLAAREHRLALEAACDLEALRLTGSPVSDYGRLLLRFASNSERRILAAGGAALGAASGYRTLERRLKMLQIDPAAPAARSRSGRIGVGMALAAVVGLSIPWRLEAQQAGTTATTTPSPATSVAAGSAATSVATTRSAPTAGTAASVSKATQKVTKGSKTKAQSPTTATTVIAGTAAAGTAGTTIITGVPTPSVSGSVVISDTPTSAAPGPVTGLSLAGRPAVKGNISTSLSVSRSAFQPKPSGTGLSIRTSGGLALGTPVATASSVGRRGSLTVGGSRTTPALGGLALGGGGGLEVEAPKDAPALQFKGTHLSAALRTLFSRTHRDFVQALGEYQLAQITGDFKSGPVEEVLDSFLGRAGVGANLTVLNEHGIIVVTEASDEPRDQITLKFYERNGAEALDAFFAAAHVSYRLDPTLEPAHNVTMSLTNANFRVALDSLLMSAFPNASFRVEGGVYDIVRRQK